MRIIFLGTGTSQGVPVIACPCSVCASIDQRDKRLRSSVYIEVDGIRIVIDTGPDFRQQMLREGILNLDAILLTHGHKDHIGGLDDVRAYNYIQRQAMDIYGNAIVLDDIRREFSYAFGREKYPGVPELNLIEIGTRSFQIGSVNIIPISALHHSMPVTGFRIGAFTYITDASYIPLEEIEKIKGSDIVVLNALRHRKHHSHFNLEEALDILSQINPKAGYLTHISHQMGTYADVTPILPAGIHMAYDGLSLDL